MNDENSGRVHWSFWLIAGVTLIWNLLGSINFVMQMNPDVVAAMPETHRAIIDGRPVWATAGFALAVFGGAIGCVLLLFKQASAFFVFIASLLGVVATMAHTLGIAGEMVDFSPFEIFMMIAMPLVVAAFLVWYSKLAERKGWIS